MQTGTVKWFNATKGYGFIEPSNKSGDIFLHKSSVELIGLRSLNEGQRLSFEIESKNGKNSAVNIQLI